MKLLTSVCCFAALVEVLAGQVSGLRAECPSDFTYVSSVNGCYKVITDNLEWRVAQLRCMSLHDKGHLLAISDEDEHNAVAKFLSKISDKELSGCWTYPHGFGVGFYTAGHRIDPSRADSTFVWSVPPNHGLRGTDMLEMRYTNFETGQPDSYPGYIQPCLYLFRGRNYKWTDHDCYSRVCSICEIDV